MEEFLKQLPELLVLLALVGGGGFTAVLLRWIGGRNERLMVEQKHRQRMEVLQAKHEHQKRLAAALDEPIKLLALDPDFGKDFERRLRVALDEKTGADTDAAEHEAEREAQEVQRTTRRKQRS